MKGLKALDIIKNASTIYVGCASNIYTRYSFECDEIEKELKAYEELESIHEELAKAYNKLCQEKIEWLKQKQALEIIKKHKLLNYIFKNEKCLNMYHLSKEEIVLLKEYYEY